MAKKKEPQVVARVTIERASEMTPKGRKEVADWLRSEARNLVKLGREYSRRYVGRYSFWK